MPWKPTCNPPNIEKASQLNNPGKQTQRDQLQALLRKGFEELTRGRIREAGECCRQALKIMPDLVEGHFLVGLIVWVANY